MKTPSYWNSVNFMSLALWPLGCLYGLATALRLLLKRTRKVQSTVICVGNLTAGGTGKTPVAVSLAKLLQQNGKNPCFLSRGYGGRRKNLMVNPCRHTAADVGDEPLLLARQAPVIVNPNRYQGALMAEQEGADYIIMDDGFQNPSLYKDISLLVIDGDVGLGNGFCIPAGPLREFKKLGLHRASAVALIGDDKLGLAASLSHLPIFRGRLKAVAPSPLTYDIVAFAGIGRPQKFYRSLRDCGFNVVQTRDFPDHHFYSENDHLQSRFKVLEIAVEWENPAELADFLLQ